ncbi:hypothetical protein GLA29479_4326 [Lysobacter antibioticus]|uniref:DUF2785 domain-containing protein n=1 Tax=Lysobacter antibioticus TaxID=84531 RepID=UPI0007224A6A|nr:DUF2785 domain-containing protein [Lysobacter antibioticus]ALN65163.1 hypothetical protein GLA29479_4326 [Lysobacter antibioticus]
MRLVLLLSACLLAAPAFAGVCPPAGHTAASLQALKARQFALPDAAEKQALAAGLIGCLSASDPELRDGIAFEALSQWMRAGDFDANALRAMRDSLYATLGSEDGPGFGPPFAALVLSEVARTDRIKAWMTPQERAAMVERAAAYVESVRDYRGYIEGQGWRHGVAHGADWLMQLSLNPALERAQYERILAAIASQAVPGNGHAYVFGESERLARPLLFTAQRGLLSAEDWQAWFAALSAKVGKLDRADYAGWLGRRHDLTAFLSGLYVQADQSEDAAIKALKPAILAALKQAP